MPPHAKPTDKKENHAPLGTLQPSAKRSRKTCVKDASTNPKAPSKQAKWSSADDATLIQVLTDQQAAGNQADNSWKGHVWQAVCTELASSELHSGGAPKTASKCHTRWDKLKLEFLAVKRLQELSGWSWDDVQKMVHTTDEIWANHIAMNPESEIWRSKGFPLYDEILPLVEGRHATGELVYYALEPNSSIAGDFGHENCNDISNSAHDDIPEELYDWPPSDPIETPSLSTSPASNPRKCAASPALTPASKRTHKTKLTGPAAVADVADALCYVATQLATGDSANSAPAAPQRRTAAICVVTMDKNLTCDEQVELMALFVTNIAAADSYLAINDAELHTEFIRHQLATLI